jgi:hypothetical protein
LGGSSEVKHEEDERTLCGSEMGGELQRV